MQTPYVADAEGRLRAVLPARCPLGADGSACRIELRYHRARKTGPRFPLAVVRCAGHGVAFTLYPPGHVPYGRIAVLPLDPAGQASREPSWSSTLWRAAHDAAAGQRWPLEAGEPADRRTQGRWLERGATLLGLDLATSLREQEQLASALSVPLLTIRHAPRASFAAGASWTARGQAITDVLREVARPAGLLVAGHVVGGLWGRPSRWDPGGHVPVPV